jgi:hypothetical protein
MDVSWRGSGRVRCVDQEECTGLALAAEKAIPEKAYRSAMIVIPAFRSLSIADLIIQQRQHISSARTSA